MSKVNQFIEEKIIDHGIEVIKYDTSPGSINRSLKYYFKKILVIIKASLFLLKYNKASRTKLYLSVSGRYGKLSELIYVIIARLKNIQMILHHHSFLYIDKTQLIAKLLFWLSGKKSYHIVLSDNMGILLKNKYSLQNNMITISNIAFYEIPEKSFNRSNYKIKTLGFLSNISFEKGIDTFVNLIDRLQEFGVIISADIVGPFENKLSKKYMDSVTKSNNNIKYIGPLYGDKKKDFYNKVDLFILPSLNEAEPLVIYESLMNSIPVISTSVGCVPEQIGNNSKVGISINKEDFIEKSTEWILERINFPLRYKESRIAALNQFIYLKANSNNQLDKFISLFN